MSHTFWLTGLSGSGKSTLANMLKSEIKNIVVLDGDEIRKGLCNNLGFSEADRTENLRRIAEVCKLFNDNGMNVITAFISPFHASRELAKSIIQNCRVVHVAANFEVCAGRDTKGLYKKALAGEIKNFTGLDSPFETPLNPDLTVDTGVETVDVSYEKFKKYILECIHV